MPTPSQTYQDWRNTLTKPDDSIFYYHPDEERILLGLAIYTIASRSLLTALGKAESLKLLHNYVTDLVTAWIDGKDEAFATMWQLTITLAENYLILLGAMEDEYPNKRKKLKKLGFLYSYATAISGDMSPAKAATLLDDLTTDGRRLDSPEIARFGATLLNKVSLYGIDLPTHIYASLLN